MTPMPDPDTAVILAGVDVDAGEHLLDALRQARPSGERGQQRDGVAGDAVLGVVHDQVRTGRGQRLDAPGVVGEQLAQVAWSHGGVVLGDLGPFGVALMSVLCSVSATG